MVRQNVKIYIYFDVKHVKIRKTYFEKLSFSYFEKLLMS